MSSKQWMAAAGVGLALAGAAAWGWWHGTAVAGYTARRAEFVQTIVASGHVETPHRIDLGAQITANVSDVPVAEGQRVAQGQLLIALDDRELRAAVAVRQAQVSLDLARAQHQRQSDLFRQGFIGQAALNDAAKARDLAEAQWQAAVRQARSELPSGSDFAPTQATLDAARTALQAARVRESYARIVAPAAGVLIARALAMRPPLLLADEPTGNLDTKSAEAVFALLRRFCAEAGMAVLFVTHNPELARRCDRLIEVVDGLIASR